MTILLLLRGARRGGAPLPLLLVLVLLTKPIMRRVRSPAPARASRVKAAMDVVVSMAVL